MRLVIRKEKTVGIDGVPLEVSTSKMYGFYTLFLIRIKFIRIIVAKNPKNYEYPKNHAEARFSVTQTLTLVKLPKMSKMSKMSSFDDSISLRTNVKILFF